MRRHRPVDEREPLRGGEAPRAPLPAPTADVLALQRSAGNQAVQRALLARTDDLETKQTFKPKGKKTFGQRPDDFGPVKIQFQDIDQVKGKLVRPVRVSGLVYPQSTGERPGAPEPVSGVHVSQAKAGQPKVGSHGENARNQGMADAQKGHIMALELGGPDIPQNIVPQWANWQGNGVWRKMETQVLGMANAAMANGNRLHFDAQIHYKPYRNGAERHASKKSVGTPAGFTVTVTEVGPDGKMLAQGKQDVVFNAGQQQNHTDDMMFMRTAQALADKGNEAFGYADWDPQAKKDKKKKGVQTYKGDWRSGVASPFAEREAQVRKEQAARDAEHREAEAGFDDGYEYYEEESDTPAYLQGYENGREAYLSDYWHGFLDGYHRRRNRGEGPAYYEGADDGAAHLAKGGKIPKEYRDGGSAVDEGSDYESDEDSMDED